MEPVIQTFEYLSGLLNFQNSPWCLDEAMKFTKKSPFSFKKYLKLIVSKIGDIDIDSIVFRYNLTDNFS